MSYFLGMLGVISLLFSIGSCVMSKGAVHEIEGLIWLLIAVVLLIAEAILDAIKKINLSLKKTDSKVEP